LAPLQQGHADLAGEARADARLQGHHPSAQPRVPRCDAPAPDTDGDEPDIDESTGYTRADPADSDATPPQRPVARGQLVDARGLAAELDLTPAALLVALRRLADTLDAPAPTSLDAVSAGLIDVLRQHHQDQEDP
jgi:hypothetical protein